MFAFIVALLKSRSNAGLHLDDKTIATPYNLTFLLNK